MKKFLLYALYVVITLTLLTIIAIILNITNVYILCLIGFVTGLFVPIKKINKMCE